jgi:uncharacterized protein YdaU (DUF1376 family)
MSKDPAFPFYAQDFLTGVMHFDLAEKGAYITLLCYQWAHGKIPKKRLGLILGYGWESVWETISEKFIEKDDFLMNERLEKERDKRALFKEKQSENGRKGGRPTKEETQIKAKNNPNETQTITQTQTQKKPLENENESEYEKEKEVEKENEKVGLAEISKIDFEEIISIFNSTCQNLTKVQKITTQRKSAISARIKDYGFENMGIVFKNVSESEFLNGGSDRGWKADFDWVLNPNNFIKILEGKYQNNGKSKTATGQSKVQYSDDFKRKIAESLQS